MIYRLAITFFTWNHNLETLATQFCFHIAQSPADSPANSPTDSQCLHKQSHLKQSLHNQFSSSHSLIIHFIKQVTILDRKIVWAQIINCKVEAGLIIFPQIGRSSEHFKLRRSSRVNFQKWSEFQMIGQSGSWSEYQMIYKIGSWSEYQMICKIGSWSEYQMICSKDRRPWYRNRSQS